MNMFLELFETRTLCDTQKTRTRTAGILGLSGCSWFLKHYV